tara:strand:- start:2499 stop:2768 length:270 start_codon:yes stop_codon:yes gene_type:complete
MTQEDKKQLEQYYRDYREMFKVQGWNNLLSDMTQSANTLNSIEACESEKDLYFRKGQLAVIASLLNLEAQTDTLEQQLEEEEEEELEVA